MDGPVLAAGKGFLCWLERLAVEESHLTTVCLAALGLTAAASLCNPLKLTTRPAISLSPTHVLCGDVTRLHVGCFEEKIKYSGGKSFTDRPFQLVRRVNMAGIIPLGYQTGVYDSALMGILQDCVKLPQFLDAIFSFLARRTDFYLIMEHEKAKMGFPPGVAESMVIQVRAHTNFNVSH